MASTSGPCRGARAVQTHYEILEISPAATQQQVKDAYKRLAILKHPDKNLGDTSRACAAFQQLQTAYNTLSEPTLRAKYDTIILRTTTKNPAPPPPPPPSSSSPAPERPPPPERPTAPKSRFSNIHLPPHHDDANRPPWLSRAWYEISIKHSVKVENIYREQLASLAFKNEWRMWSHTFDRLQVELRFQERLRREFRAMTDSIFGVHD